jgi:HTH-type transcriptional repressor of NAD biosynthesis genes
MMYGHGLVLGKFMPAHHGHAHLIRFAAGLCERVTVVVDCVPGEWPPAAVRAAGLAQDIAGVATVRALAAPTPQQPDEHPHFWDFWRDTLVAACGGVPDVLVCSMSYGVPLAAALGCALLPLDLGREAVPLTATSIRADPWGLWGRMLPHARQPWLARVAIEGPESTGKSTIARATAEALGFGYAPEWAQVFIAGRAAGGHPFVEADLLTIAQGHVAQERSLALLADRALIADTSLLTTLVWGRYLYGRSDPAIEALFAAEEAQAPRRRWFFTPETPWVHDAHRDVAPDAASDAARWRFWEMLVAEAERRGLAYEVVPCGFAKKRARALALAGALGPPGWT